MTAIYVLIALTVVSTILTVVSLVLTLLRKNNTSGANDIETALDKSAKKIKTRSEKSKQI